MRKKLGRLSLCCFVLAVAIFVVAYVFYHYFTPEGVFTTVFQSSAGKPFVSILFGMLGVQFLFSGIISLIIRSIFYPNEN